MQLLTAKGIWDSSTFSSTKPKHDKRLFAYFCIFHQSYLNLPVWPRKLHIKVKKFSRGKNMCYHISCMSSIVVPDNPVLILERTSLEITALLSSQPWLPSIRDWKSCFKSFKYFINFTFWCNLPSQRWWTQWTFIGKRWIGHTRWPCTACLRLTSWTTSS